MVKGTLAIALSLTLALTACNMSSVFNFGTAEGPLPAGEDVIAPIENDALETQVVEAYAPSIKFTNYLAPPLSEFKRDVPTVMGVYITSVHAGIDRYFEDHLAFAKAAGVNAMVIDVRGDDGKITFHGMEFADEMGLSVNNIPDIYKLMERLKAEGIYPIARIVAFKDSAARESMPELYIKNTNGDIWKDGSGESWLNPFNPEACQYVLNYAMEAAYFGFEEIQFDYVRFATSSLKDADLSDTGGKTKVDAITSFLQQAIDVLRPLGVTVSADVYGTIIGSELDAGIVGQDYVKIASIVDVICPMVYPSHYANGSMGIDIPDFAPYDTIHKAMQLSNEKLSAIPEADRAIVRPWLQDFTASYLGKYMNYGADERYAQIKATYDAGLSEWLLWDASNKYDAGGVVSKIMYASQGK
ncbi:MAG: putative glycoside hydrolase [Clostridiales bacterium]|jgi:hypothetical protein|nr:putative glycoside hydrolase [Clostridiales bacterium]